MDVCLPRRVYGHVSIASGDPSFESSVSCISPQRMQRRKEVPHHEMHRINDRRAPNATKNRFMPDR